MSFLAISSGEESSRERGEFVRKSLSNPEPVKNSGGGISMGPFTARQRRPEAVLYPQYRPLEEQKVLSPYVSLAPSPVQKLRGMGVLNVRRALYERGDGV
ncbi:hypothetical protein O4H49_04370 [Kiloniella laminariae]|uniref:Uncharacterized protein n=1 Tax=Kiloniella laminariae TaxID=454162 RepID=A0ABT4LFW9_9PROT|nr:hypothetical protein [Kiloniella laminariae]MCZ4280000.1 hypothetical protein [Kiloniella laminariae]